MRREPRRCRLRPGRGQTDPATAAVAAREDWSSFVELRVGGALEFLAAVDDMTEIGGWPEDFKVAQRGVRRALVEHPDLVTVELDHGSGVVVSVRR
ncbi:hypothetical protein Drose_28565 [Dactylosporangium roseum]|uniref:Uncharacterized protein n=1 Tax=Dactylosporangium roseum TaxID=47989 RepID=A0ABY5Z0F1_9ACTN|nr:hypothetical protein [Dactylosporangium roseum]UWZ35086.1 hypothetical protein Drose_28565 [Dactylosporangium roseum]